ncbi:MAG: hypothetical protein LBQ58_04975 [Synergistaceae bacterium]|nr:hypothetical protein [Synergistaceae bacterium]
MTSGPKTLFISAGEVSGDHYTARIGTLLRERGFEGKIYGLCGAESRDAGFEALWENERLHIMGITEVLSSLPDILSLMGEMYRNIMKNRPEAMVVADSPDFHLPLIRRLRHGGYRGKIFYISPPAVWAWRKYRVADLIRNVDVCMPLFNFEHDYLVSRGCNSSWTGHPLVEEFNRDRQCEDEVCSRVRGTRRPKPGDSIIALLPGSRRSEIESLYPVLSEVASAVTDRGCCPVFSIAPGLSERAREYLMSNIERNSHSYYDGPGRDIMAVSEAVAGSSGTATAQALLLRRYMIVMYKMKPLTALVGKMLLKGVYFAIPNLLAEEIFYPELIQNNANAELAVQEICKWLDMDEYAKKNVIRRMDELVTLMGSPGVYDFWADQIIGELK